MKCFLSLIVIFCNIFICNIFAQKNIHDFGFEFSENIVAIDSIGSVYTQPWVGGLNYCQFSNIDVNLDGIKDLFVFDRTGNKKNVFINRGIADSVSYSYAKKLSSLFPALKEWALCIDFNNDNKFDIFSYTTGGIVVYKNISSTSHLAFQKITSPFIYSLQGSILTNLYVTPVDLPAIADLDNDGDLDVLTFWGLGQYVQLHKNLSMEKYGHADSLCYEMVDACWGSFEENENNNQINLNIDCPFKQTSCIPPVFEEKQRHTGSTLLAVDFDNDNDKDLLLGDIDYSSVFYLENGGSIQNAHIVNFDTIFPSEQSINLYSFPATFLLDINNDNINDLIVSPFDSKTFNSVSDNINSCWLYLNKAKEKKTDFQLLTKAFLQNEMFDFGAGAYPVILDYNNDGLKDVVVANYGYRDSSYYNNYTLYSTYKSQLALLKNVGTNITPKYQLITNNLGNLSAYKKQALYPTFGDVDADNDIDMIVGNADGSLCFFENISQQDTFLFADAITNYQNINVGQYSTPQLFDINKDGLKDLLVGCKMGSIYYYKNVGTSLNPSFDLITSEFGAVDVRDLEVSNFGYSTPCFFIKNNETKLFVGSESGKIHYYKNIDNNLDGIFELFDGNLLSIYEGERIGLAVSNLNNDDFSDLIIGNFAGGLTFYKGVIPSDIKVKELKNNAFIINVFPQPAKTKITVCTKSKKYLITKITIYSMEGKKMKEYPGGRQHSMEVNICNFADGFYFLEIYTEHLNQSFKTIKKVIVQN